MQPSRSPLAFAVAIFISTGTILALVFSSLVLGGADRAEAQAAPTAVATVAPTAPEAPPAVAGVATRAELRGTHLGTLYGLPATGKALRWEFFCVARVVDGVVVAQQSSADWNDALAQLDLLAL